MNEKLKAILHRAWNEPRHFFLWLAMLSVCGFMAAVGSKTVIGPTLLFSFIALGCILCFLASVPAFVLAWIPPVRRLFGWLLRRRFVVLACLATLVALFYTVENWRGRHAWQTYKAAWEAKGEHFDLASFVPPQVPAEQNFFESPLFRDLSPANKNNRILDIFGPKSGEAPGTGNWTKPQRVDLTAWQAFYRGSNNVFSAGDGPQTNYFPVAKEPQSPAEDVLLALSRFDGNRRLLIEAAARPQARFGINYDAGYAAVLPHLAHMKAIAQYLSLHGCAALKSGDKQTALEDSRLLFRLLEATRREPTLISFLVRIAVGQIALQPLWEGLADRQWTDAELSLFEIELGKLDFLADYQFAMRGERAFNLWAVDFIHKAGISGWTEMASSEGQDSKSDEFLGKAAFRLVPAGWFDQNKLSLCLAHERYSLPAVDMEKRLVSTELSRPFLATLGKQRLRPYDVFSRMLLPAVARIAERSARAQTSVDLARVACALERYRLANTRYPETLLELPPKYIPELPHDVISGKPLGYHRTEDGQFVLYSVGWNGTDDGGKVELTKAGNPDPDKGDWVWSYTAAR